MYVPIWLYSCCFKPNLIESETFQSTVGICNLTADPVSISLCSSNADHRFDVIQLSQFKQKSTISELRPFLFVTDKNEQGNHCLQVLLSVVHL